MFSRVIFVAMAAAGIVAAQDPPNLVGRLNHVEGSVSFQPGGVSDWVPATINRPLTAGDQLYADAGARAEIHVPGAAFRLGSQTAFEFMNLDDRNVQVRLSEGTLNIHALSLEANVEIDTPNLAFQITRPGVYRIDTNPNTNETYVTVRNGEGQVTSNSGAFPVHMRQQAIVSGQDQQVQYNVYQAPGFDEFDNWAASRDRREVRGPSARYVSSSMVGYEDLDEYGTWRQVPEYGRCWVPRHVAADWSPYHNGHWAWVDPWGWSWVDDEPWGFAPYHYGRWAHFGDTWGWVPGPVASRPVYAPALVAWVGFGGGGGVSLGIGGGSPSVGWFPLGPRDVYIPSYSASRDYVSRVNVTNTTVVNNTTVTNVYNNYVQNRPVSNVNYANRAVPGAVVAVPQNAFASARPVQQVATRVSPAQLTAMRPAAFAPAVTPQVASVLGRPGSVVASTPRPSAAVMSRPVVAKTAPAPPLPSFQQRQTLLARTPGRPVPIQQQQQMARSAPAPAVARPPVKVVAQAPVVAPRVMNTPAPPRPAPTATAPRPNAPMAQPVPPQMPAQPQRGVPAQAQPVRPQTPPSVQQQQARPVQPNRPATVPPPQNRPFEPPAVQQRQVPPVQPNRPAPVPQQQPRVQPPPQNRPFEPPAVQQRQAPPVQPNRPAPVPQQQPRVQPLPPHPTPQQPRVQPPPPQNRPYAPPAVQQRQAPAQPVRPPEPPRQQPAAQPQARPNNPPPPAQERNRNVAPPPRPQAPLPQQRQAAPPPPQRREERKKQEHQ